jgi:lycopene cyclase domain-containing protein
MEYTIASAAAALIVVGIDHALGVRIIRRRSYWIFLAVMAVFKLIVNGYLTWRPIVEYGPRHFLGVRLWTIPLEDFVYGFGLITLTITLWEYLNGRANERRSDMRSSASHITTPTFKP